MNKVILVMNDPMFCYNCPLAQSHKNMVTKKEHWFCGIGDNECEGLVFKLIDVDSETRPDWCPLREMPEKYDMDNVVCDRDYDGDYEYGYNACIDEILE